MGLPDLPDGVNSGLKRMDARDWAALAVSFVVAVSFGLCYGDANSNQTTYLLDGIKNAHPELWQNDWYVSQTTHYHKLFTYLVTILENSGVLPWGLAFLNIAAIVAALWAVYEIIGAVTLARFRVWLVTVAVFVLYYKTMSAGFSYVFTTGLQPSALAGVFFTLAMAFYAKARYGMSGVMLGAAGIFHANYGVLAIPVFAAAHLIDGGKDLRARLTRQLVFPVLAILAQFPVMLRIAGFDLSREIRDFAHLIFVNIALPFHYKTDAFLIELLPFAAWALIAYDPLKRARERGNIEGNGNGRGSYAARIEALFLALALFMAFYFVFSSLFPVDLIVRLCFFRLAPYLLLLSVIFFSAELVEGSGNTDRSGWETFRIAAASVLFARYMVYFDLYEYALFIAAGLLRLPAITARWRSRSSKYALAVLAVAIGVFSAWNYQDTYMKKHKYTLIFGDHPDTVEFYDWVGTTDKGAVFLTPPVMNEFRVLGRRAAVVDWQGIPFRPDELIVWHSRMKDVTDNGTSTFYQFITSRNIRNPEYLEHVATGKPKRSFPSTSQMLLSNLVAIYIKGYDNAITKKLTGLTAKYGVDYVVARKDLRLTDYGIENVAFENNSYVVYGVDPKKAKPLTMPPPMPAGRNGPGQ